MLIRTVTRFSSQKLIRRLRLLPRPGRILARKGQQVRWDDVVAETILNLQWIMIDVADGLDLSPQRSVDFIRSKIGNNLNKGDLLAQGAAGYTQRNVYSPVTGRVLWIGGGRILLENHEHVFSLNAIYPGRVREIITDRGVEIECSGALIQGLWGNGRFSRGRLVILESCLDKSLDPGQIDASMQGRIILGGVITQVNVLKKAADLGIAGLILASMPAKLIPEAQQVPFPIMLVQGFGIHPWIDCALDILRVSANDEMILNAVRYDPYRNERPEVFVPVDAALITGEESVKPSETWTPIFTPGQRVRVMFTSHMGKSGIIHKISSLAQPLENGVSGLTAEVVLENRETIVVPIANLDVLE